MNSQIGWHGRFNTIKLHEISFTVRQYAMNPMPGDCVAPRSLSILPHLSCSLGSGNPGADIIEEDASYGKRSELLLFAASIASGMCDFGVSNGREEPQRRFVPNDLNENSLHPSLYTFKKNI